VGALSASIALLTTLILPPSRGWPSWLRQPVECAKFASQSPLSLLFGAEGTAALEDDEEEESAALAAAAAAAAASSSGGVRGGSAAEHARRQRAAAAEEKERERDTTRAGPIERRVNALRDRYNRAMGKPLRATDLCQGGVCESGSGGGGGGGGAHGRGSSGAHSRCAARFA
jgi:hypothetical protein